jgi:hypothetical protein
MPSAQGLDPRIEIRNTDDLGRLRIEMKKLVSEGVPSSMPRSICPPKGNVEEDRQAKREQQEERDRHARRRVPIRPNQPQPTGQTPLDRTLDALLGG